MEGISSPQRSRSLMLWLAPLLIVTLFVTLQAWNSSRQLAATRAEAGRLLTRLDTAAAVTTEEYAVWKQLAAADPKVRLEAVKLFSDARYAPVLRNSQELVGRTIVGNDTDGAVSRQLAEALVCAPLENAPATANDEVPIYLVPWLNPSALHSEPCARILTARLLAADPGAFAGGAQLLALVLAALPPEPARTSINTIVERIAVADAGSVDVLFSALRHVSSADFPAEFSTALATLAARISAAQGSAEIASLFDAVDSLKYSVPAGELAPVFDAALGQMLARNDSDLTRELYFTLTDLKITHPDTSFGRRADYLMRGINVYSDALEIYDYSRVLALDEQYPAQDAAIARELLNGIRALDPANYQSSIVPYCKRFLESSAALDYADFLPGAQLLVEQLHNPGFIFQRPCLLDSGLVERIAPADRGALAQIVVEALTGMSGPGASNRVAEAVELLGMLGSELDSAQTAQLADFITTMAATGTESWNQAKVASAAAAAANLDFPPAFYSELFVRIINTTNPDGSAATVPPALLEKLPETQRRYVVSTALSALAALSTPLEDAEALAAQLRLLMVLKPWLSAADVDQAATSITTALEDARSIPVFSRLTSTLSYLKPQLRGQPTVIRAAWLRHMAASNERADLAQLFEGGAQFGVVRPNDPESRAAVQAAAVRFLEQIVPRDAYAGAVRGVLAKPPAESTLPQLTAPDGSPERAEQTRQRTREIAQRTRGSRVQLEAEDMERLSARYIRALAEERVSHPIADYALSLGTLATYSRPGELDGVLDALHQRLDASADPASHEVLVSVWITVENATNAEGVPAQRLPLYQNVLLLPLTNAASRAALVAAAGKIVEQDFAGNMWTVLAWTPPATTAP